MSGSRCVAVSPGRERACCADNAQVAGDRLGVGGTGVAGACVRENLLVDIDIVDRVNVNVSISVSDDVRRTVLVSA